MSTLLPRDDDFHPIPALRLRSGGAHRIDASANSARNIIAFDTDTHVIGIFATGPVFIRTGDAEVAASSDDHFFPEGLYYDIALGDERQGQHSHIAVLAADVSCILYVSEKQ
jgi:hypothetical protein